MAAEYSRLKLIGRGGFGLVYSAMDKDGNTVAIKKISLDRCSMKSVEHEIEAMQALSKKCPHRFVELFATAKIDGNVEIYMEFCRGGTLDTFMKTEFEQLQNKYELRPAQIRLHVLNELFAGLEVIHGNGLMHRDLKPNNVLDPNMEAWTGIARTILGKNVFPYAGIRFLISDFGLCKEAPDILAYATGCGTPGYLSPQVRARRPYSKECDIYSMGGIHYFMLIGQNPAEFAQFSVDGTPKFVVGKSKIMAASSAERALLETMMQRDPEKRQFGIVKKFWDQAKEQS